MKLPQLQPETTITTALPRLISRLENSSTPSSAILVMVDGLGSVQLEEFSSYAPFLRRQLKEQQTGDTAEPTQLSTIFPTTTAAALSSVGTGLDVGCHGLIGYDVYDPERGVVINQLGGWDERTDPEQWQPYPTVFQNLVEPLRAVSVSLPAFEDSALTRASLAGTEFFGEKALARRVSVAIEQAKTPNTLVYLYFNELDQAGHRYGPGSDQWLEVLEELDSHLRRLHRGLEKLETQIFAVVTGDHGMLEVPEEGRIDFSLDPQLIDGIETTAGEPRFVQLHFSSTASDALRAEVTENWHRAYGEQAWIVTREEALDAGIFGQVETRVKDRIGDLMVAPFGPIALYDGRRASEASFEMIGHHGSLTDAERYVPWIHVGNATQ